MMLLLSKMSEGHLVLFLLLSFIASTSALKCYECEFKCKDGDVGELKDCSNPDNPDEPPSPPACFYWESKAEGFHEIRRSCSHSEKMGCEEGTDYGKNGKPINDKRCHCNSDGCNKHYSASPQMSLNVLAIVFAFTSLYRYFGF